MIKLSFLFVASLMSAGTAAAQDRGASGPQLQLSAAFNDTTTAAISRVEKPILIRQPTLAELDAADPSRPEEFGLAFNCAISNGGTLDDCRLLYAAPDRTGADALIKTLMPRIRIAPDSVAAARTNAYRLTISASRMVMVGFGMPRTCLPPFCMVEGVRPPPPPPSPHDPALQDAMARAQTCFDAAWEDSRKLRFATEKAQTEKSSSGRVDSGRALAVAYVRSRQRVMDCIVALDRAAAKLPLGAEDAKLARSRIEGMRFSYFGQTKYEMAILIGLLDRDAAKAEESYFYPN